MNRTVFTYVLLIFLTIPSLVIAQDHDAIVEENDPLENANRAVYKFNDALDKALLRPISKVYRKAVPEVGRKAVRNALYNLKEPVYFANSVLQGDAVAAMSTLWRFGINSSIGVAGLMDVAGKHTPFKRDQRDFGQTLGKYGVGSGAYLVVPLLGPSSVRDFFGTVADGFSDPYYYKVDGTGIAGRAVISAIDKSEETLNVREHVDSTSLDPYASIRSLYTQSRNKAVSKAKSQ